MILSVLAGLAALILLRRAAARLVRVLAALAVAATVVAWGVAQYPYLLGTHTPIGTVAAPDSSLDALASTTKRRGRAQAGTYGPDLRSLATRRDPAR